MRQSDWKRTRAAVADAIAQLPATLASEKARRDLLAVTAGIPSIEAPFGFECRLSAGKHPVDFGFAVASAAAASVLGAARGEPPGSPRERVAALAARLVRDAELRAWVPFLFLEFDVDATLAPAPVPSLFAALDSPLAPRPGSGPDLDAALAVIVALRGVAADASLEVVRRAHATLPPGGRFLHVGVLCGRAEAGVRLSVLLETTSVASYLGALEADAAAAAARAALADFAPWLPVTQVDFDCGPPIGARIGIGLPPESAGALHTALVEHARASPARLEALASWNRSGAATTPRRISHLKLVCAPEGVVEGKAYLEVSAA